MEREHKPEGTRWIFPMMMKNDIFFRPRLFGREKQTPKTCAHGRRKEDPEEKMEDRRA
jgi:hypothetical protein